MIKKLYKVFILNNLFVFVSWLYQGTFIYIKMIMKNNKFFKILLIIAIIGFSLYLFWNKDTQLITDQVINSDELNWFIPWMENYCIEEWYEKWDINCVKSK